MSAAHQNAIRAVHAMREEAARPMTAEEWAYLRGLAETVAREPSQGVLARTLATGVLRVMRHHEATR